MSKDDRANTKAIDESKAEHKLSKGSWIPGVVTQVDSRRLPILPRSISYNLWRCACALSGVLGVGATVRASGDEAVSYFTRWSGSTTLNLVNHLWLGSVTLYIYDTRTPYSPALSLL